MMRDKEEYIEKYCIKLPIYILQNSYIWLYVIILES
jgi:hypothetical protein